MKRAGSLRPISTQPGYPSPYPSSMLGSYFPLKPYCLTRYSDPLEACIVDMLPVNPCSIGGITHARVGVPQSWRLWHTDPKNRQVAQGSSACDASPQLPCRTCVSSGLATACSAKVACSQLLYAAGRPPISNYRREGRHVGNRWVFRIIRAVACTWLPHAASHLDPKVLLHVGEVLRSRGRAELTLETAKGAQSVEQVAGMRAALGTRVATA